MAKSQPPSAESPKDLESAMRSLDELLGEMETGALPLEELIGRYERGVELVRFCQQRLAGAEERIRKITRNADGSLELEPMEDSENE